MTFSARIRHWCEDSLYLLDHMVRMIPGGRKEAFRKEAMRFFSGINYERAGAARSLSVRYAGYLTVWKQFGLRYAPPFRHLKSGIYLILEPTPLYPALRSMRNGLRRICRS